MTDPVVTYRAERLLVTDQQLADWEVVDDGQGRPIQAEGPCPSCQHRTDGEVKLTVYGHGAGGVSATLAPVERITRVFECACGMTHMTETDPPEPQDSCGRWWLASIRLAADGPGQRVRRGIDDTLLSAAKALEAAGDAEETRLRAAAGHWTAGVAALLGLFGVSGVVVGKDSLLGLTLGARVAAGVLTCLALVSAGAAIVLSYRAAYGWPVLDDVGDDDKLRQWFESRRGHLKVAADELKNAVRWALIALGLLAAALALIWFRPSQPARPVVQVNRTDESSICGTLLDTSASGTVRIKTPAGEVQVVKVTDIQSVKGTTAAACQRPGG